MASGNFHVPEKRVWGGGNICDRHLLQAPSPRTRRGLEARGHPGQRGAKGVMDDRPDQSAQIAQLVALHQLSLGDGAL